jgi:alcohol dehydrogenase YqhD (iron-dependent ADH family)
MNAFTYTANPTRVVFGTGLLATLAEEIERLDARRALGKRPAKSP